MNHGKGCSLPVWIAARNYCRRIGHRKRMPLPRLSATNGGCHFKRRGCAEKAGVLLLLDRRTADVKLSFTFVRLAGQRCIGIRKRGLITRHRGGHLCRSEISCSDIFCLGRVEAFVAAASQRIAATGEEALACPEGHEAHAYHLQIEWL